MICSICKSTKVKEEKRGFSGLKGAGGFILAGPIGGFLGFHKSKESIYTCQNCGKVWTKSETKKPPKIGVSFWIILSIVIFVLWKVSFFSFILS